MANKESPNVNNLEISLLVIERDTAQFKQERINDLINKIGQAKGIQDAEKKSETKQPFAVIEVTFNILNFETKEGAKLGSYELAHKTNNLQDKWQHAYNILRNSNATIQNRYHGEGYVYSYWLYEEHKIYRQKLKATT